MVDVRSDDKARALAGDAVGDPVPLRCLLVEDHRMLREGLALLLQQTGAVEVVGQVECGADARAAMAGGAVDVAVLDIALAGEDGIALAAELNVPTVMLTMYDDPSTVDRALRAGALGYVLKGGDVAELVDAIRAAAAGERWLDSKLSRASRGGPEVLSAREIEVLRGVAQGWTSADIAAHLGVATKTVQHHRARIMDKLGIRSTAGLVRYALRAGVAE